MVGRTARTRRAEREATRARATDITKEKERWVARTEGAADVFARFLELMAARGRGDGKIASETCKC